MPKIDFFIFSDFLSSEEESSSEQRNNEEMPSLFAITCCLRERKNRNFDVMSHYASPRKRRQESVIKAGIFKTF